MSRTDAQQPTRGYLVGYLRLTQNRANLDPNSWFKQVLFAGCTWRPGHFGKNAVEESFEMFRIFDGTTDLGSKRLKLTHDDQRPLNHKHPATWIHWESLQPYLQANNRQGWFVEVERDNSANPSLIIRFSSQRPSWRPGS